MSKILWCGILCGLIALLSFSSGKEQSWQVPKGWPQPAYDFRKNELSSPKVQLGRMLFYDPILSRDSTVSCASCHLQYTGFAHTDHDLSHGVAGKIGNRNAPGLVNLAWSRSFMWDGAVNHLDVQALAPISNPLEMDESLAHVLRKLQATGRYPALFRQAFGDSLITGEHLLKAMSQFMLTLVSCNSRYDRVMRGEEHFSEVEAQGYVLFKKHCNSCHTAPLFTNNQYENNGLSVDETLKDYGRMAVTHRPADSLKFKVPSLRNVMFTYPYMHDGRFKNLNQVLNNYIMGIQQTPTLNPQLRNGIYLSIPDKAALVAFLMTLTDSAFLRNPAFSYPQVNRRQP